MKYLSLPLLLFCFLTSSICHAGDLNKGLIAAQNGDFTTALKEWMPLAKQGNASAQNNLGVMFQQGNGVRQDYKEALKWYRLAAEKGDAYAGFNLGDLYENGNGVQQDYQKAVKWFRVAAQQGNVEAQTNLGLMYARGYGVIQSKVIAHMWWNIAAASGYMGAEKNKNIIEETMTQSQLAEAEKIARDCFKKKYKNCQS